MADQDSHAQIEQIQKAVAEAHYEEALDRLHAFAKKARSSDMIDEVVKCQSRLADLNKRIRQATVDDRASAAEREKIKDQILKLAREVPAEPSFPPTTDGLPHDAPDATPTKVPDGKKPAHTVDELLTILEDENLTIELRHITRVLRRLHLGAWLILLAGVAAVFSAGFCLGPLIASYDDDGGPIVQRSPLSELEVAKVEVPEKSEYLGGQLGRLAVGELEGQGQPGDAVVLVTSLPLPHAAEPFRAEISTALGFELDGFAFLYPGTAPKELVPAQLPEVANGTPSPTTKLQVLVASGNKGDEVVFLLRLSPTPTHPIPEETGDLLKLLHVKVSQ